MIYITGDLHGDIQRFEDKTLKKLKKQDTLIVCGDFGFLWDGNPKEAKILRKLSRKKFTILFVEGSHDNLAMLAQYPSEEWQGGRVHRIAPNILHLIRGNVYNIEGKTIFAFGGAKSVDLDGDSLSSQWWDLELPAPQEMEAGLAALTAAGNQVDCIVTHDCAAKLKSLLTMDVDSLNSLNDYLEEINQRVKFKKWYFGCYHLDKPMLQNVTAVFKEVHTLS